MSVLYHLIIANIKVDTFSRMSTGSITHVKNERKDLAKDAHPLNHLGMRLSNSNEGDFLVNDGQNDHW